MAQLSVNSLKPESGQNELAKATASSQALNQNNKITMTTTYVYKR